MRSKLMPLIISLLFAVAAKAQQVVAPVTVSLPRDGYVSFRNRAEWIDLRQAARQLPASLASQALPDSNDIIHRILRDRDGHFVFGYDLWISADRAARQFTIAIRPLDPRLEMSLRPSASSAFESLSTFPKPTEPQTVTDNSEFSVDLLVNKNSGVKFVDVVKVSFDRSSREERPTPRPRDFSADAVAMEMKDYSLLLNDDLIATGKSKTGSTGALLWLYVPRRGRFIFSLVPRLDYGFEKAGTVSANKIEFSIRGDHYEWFSSSPILHEEGKWNLWVLFDPNYTPLMGVAVAPPTHEKGALQRLDDKINGTIQKSSVGVQVSTGLQGTSANRTEPNQPNARVMCGAADRIENLLPRN
jgi:hypothetical protein